MKNRVLSALLLGVACIAPLDSKAQDASSTTPTCDTAKVQALEANPGDVGTAISTIATCLTEMDGTLDVHVDDNFQPTYGVDDPKLSDPIRLTNLLIRMADLEEYNGTFCLSEEECAKNCPTIDNLSNDTCSPDKKTPHAPGLLTTDDPNVIVKNLANRVLALRPKVMEFETGDFGDDFGDSGLDDGSSDTGLDSGLDGSTTTSSSDDSGNSGL